MRYENAKAVKDFYDSYVLDEWSRIDSRPEFFLTCRMLERYIKPADTVFDIGGGPGRYSIYLAKKGCAVTLLDLSPENVSFAKGKAAEEGLSIKALVGDVREAPKLVQGVFDHVLLMGPLYHLLEEKDRILAVESALSFLKPGGLLFASFISMSGGIVYAMAKKPELVAITDVKSNHPDKGFFIKYREDFLAGRSFAGDSFTKSFFIDPKEILPFMSGFPLEKLHLFSQEGILSPCEANIMTQPPEVVNAWLNFCEEIWEREDFFSWAEHLMYVGRKH